ncbi:transcriptional regulator [Mycobacterium sp. MS1601]|uniref:FMN-binding negative transcriptional regulator n=1 Tax=Mycobacterium sp. MS1601 TaxID=1936029 RepID=UPI00097917F3|nr:FMN-binding negative transcriptional regulator [Mycobacterium sp. MS1601]AQA03402.1 transcriptional regulator [Mycobacterium sp. MS1601]
MYVPSANRLDDDQEIRALVAAVATANFVTVDNGVPVSTLLPIVWEHDTVIAHIAKANPQWQSIADGDPALLICTGSQAYISPSWYPAKAEHGRVVPTWNYSAVHLTGTVALHDDSDWLRNAVDRLTNTHEQTRSQPWRTTDAPQQYIRGQLNGIVGLEITVQKVEAKAKLSQNRSEADRGGVINGLHRDGHTEMAEAMESL